ncbi:helix-turn-helix domain-containing protein [Xinfangfangia sp. D13-10-4-6]|uniref:helix-turn-helix domain-containing protein n=1 Tax=Pseudogemmobacter hezensis TaxID=2737662 RepID=UPI0015561436|nr:helix-turn-helix domain-containing protein [Pseudogemmobacter hezensis]NPD15453.1 helix-turn-helix domain-containing protein [Pseudogemmobacter hezensis]
MIRFEEVIRKVIVDELYSIIASLTAAKVADLLLTTRQAAEHLGTSVHTLEAYRYKGTGPEFVKCGGSIRYYASALTQWIETGGDRPH